MKEALLKKRFGVPAALLLVLLLVGTSGTVIAWSSFGTMTSTTTVNEPLSTANEEDFSAFMYPGESRTWTFDIENSADVEYSVKADLTTYSVPAGVSITSFHVGDANVTSDLLADGSAVSLIPASETILCRMKITATGSASPGDVTITLALSRQSSQ